MRGNKQVTFRVLALAVLLIVNFTAASPQSGAQKKRLARKSRNKNIKEATANPATSKKPDDQEQVSAESKCVADLKSCKLGNDEACKRYLKACFWPEAQVQAEAKPSQKSEAGSEQNSSDETVPEPPEVPRGFSCDYYRKECRRGNSDACKLYLIECC